MGEEFSLFASGQDKFYIMPTAQDHKHCAPDGDKGPNTGGMVPMQFLTTERG